MSSSSMNKYWIPHLDIHRKVITQELQYYLGPEATVRPYTLEVPRLWDSLEVIPAHARRLREKMVFSSLPRALV